MSLKIIILQHTPLVTPGHLTKLMNEDLVETTIIRLDEEEKIPVNLDIFDGMICLGGPMDTWMEEQYPWMIDEKNKIKEFVLNNQKPYLGICLGCQFLGEILGGKVIKSNPPEIGILNINVLDNKKNDQIFQNFNNQIKALQWHSYEVSELNNSDVTILGSSDITKFQIFKYKNHAYGIQFHIEVDENTIIKWSKVTELKNALEKYLGKNSIDELDKLLRYNIQEMNNNTKILYKNFKNLMTT
ncbi:type 1 glutamine amidotransferase [Pelagibacteraceae bacterium]|nr:type 1 glutamine amidotransferase [Pelagibacteraceae bacterium]